MKETNKKKIFISSVLVLLFLVAFFNPFGTKSIYTSIKSLFDANSAPAHSKGRTDNPDGTYKLSLDVTGRSRVDKTDAKANILVVYDVSGSMNEDDAYNYTETEAIGNNQYCKIGDNYYSVTTNAHWNYKGTDTEYTGTYKYQRADSDHNNYSSHYGIINNSVQQVWYRNGSWRTSNSSYGTVYNGAVYSRSNRNGGYSDDTTYYGFNDTTDEMVELEAAATYTCNGEAYEGTRYTRSSTTRAAATEKAVYTLADKLFDYNTDENPNNVQMALIAFSSERSNGYNSDYNGNAGTEETAAWTVQGWTNSESTFLNNLSNTGNSTELKYGGGTNWEAALTRARNYIRSTATDSDPTYVIFVTDGAPTMYIGDNSGTGRTPNYNDYTRPNPVANAIYNTNTATHSQDTTNRNTDIFGIYAYGTEDDYLDDVIYYAHNGQTRPNSQGGVSEDTVATDKYYKAGDTTALNRAIADIFKAIVDALGVTKVSIADGTTNVVQTSTGEISKLLEVDPNSYEYWMSFPTEKDGNKYKITRVDIVSGDPYTIELTDNGNGTFTATWTLNEEEHSETLTGSIDEYNVFKYKWTAANDFYEFAPNAAALNPTTGSVDWNLNNVGTLLNGVTYTVTFDVYPSDYVYETVADLKNGIIEYGDLPSEVREYLHKDGDNYTLETNKTASLTYTDTTEENPVEHTTTYTNPPAIKAPASEIDVTKHWLNQIDWRDAANATGGSTLNIYLLKDGNKIDLGNGEYEKLEVKAPNWMDSKYIAVGAIRTKNVNGKTITEVLNPGHEYTLEEPTGISYHWELEIEVVRPMIVNGQLTTLVKVTDEEVLSEFTDGVTYKEINGHHVYKIGDNVYYDKYVNDEQDRASLNAINNRKSYLELIKEVDGDANKDKEFKFNVQIDNINDKKGEVWFSVQDTLNNNVTVHNITTNATAEEGDTGFYYIKNTVTVDNEGNRTVDLFNLEITLKQGWKVRFINLGTGSTYEITEDTDNMPDLFTLKEIVGTTTATSTLDLPITAVDQGDGITFIDGDVTYTKHTASDDLGGYVYYTYDYEPEVNGNKITGEIVTANTPYLVRYINSYPKTYVDVIKEWVGTKKDVNVDLYRDGSKTETNDTLTSTNEYKTTFEELDIKDSNNNVYNYSVKEEELANYRTTYTGSENIVVKSTNKENTIVTITVDGEAHTLTLNEENNYTDKLNVNYVKEDGSLKDVTVEADKEITYLYTDRVINIKNVETKDITVTKIWDDDSDRDGIRPNNLTINLTGKVTGVNDPVVSKSTSATTNTAVVDGKDNWTYTFSGVDRYYVDEDGNEKEITYTADEASVPTGYTKTQSTDTFTITNKHDPAKHDDIVVTKKWVDDNDRDDLRPENITFILTATDSEGNVVTSDEKRGVLTGSGDTWTYTFTDLPAKANGKDLTYSVDEASVPGGYTKTFDQNDSYTIINTHEPAKHDDIVVTKKWVDDNDRDDLRPENITFILTATDSEGNVVKADEKRGVLTGSGDTWTYTFTDLPAKANGKDLTYSVDEASVPGGYTKTFDQNDSYTIINTHEPAKHDDIVVTKKWVDDNDRDDLRPENITFILTATDSEGNVVKADEKTGVLSGSGDTWTYTFTDLPAKANGKELTYTVDEASVPGGYTKTFDQNDSYTIINTHEPAKHTDITVTKKWEDDSNRDDLRPENITFILTATDSDGNVVSADEKTGVLSGSGNTWTYTFTDLPAKANGKDLTYSVDESAVPTGYTKSFDQNDSYTIINTHIPTPHDSIVVTKRWVDDNDRDGIRPDTLQVVLTGTVENETSTEKVYERTETISGNEWTFEFTGLNMYDLGRPITYTVDEVSVPGGYTKTFDENDEYTIINTHEPAKHDDITVTKKWEDDSNRDAIRPENITFILTATDSEGNVVKADEKTGVLTGNGDTWTYTFTDLPAKANGKELTYTVDEASVPGGYTKTFDENDKYTIINTHEPAKHTDITVTKKWVDDSNRDDLRPEEITFILTATDSEGNIVKADEKTGVLTGSGDTWTYTFTDLPAKANGKELTYTVDEASVPGGYTKTFDENDEYTIINTHTPGKYGDILVTKKWDDDSNRDNIRPGSIVINLIATDSDGNVVASDSDSHVFTGTGNEWTWTFRDLPAMSNGKVLTYTIDEESVPAGYKKSVDNENYIITNKHVPTPYGDLEVTKHWEDDENRDNLRTPSVTLVLVGKALNVEVSRSEKFTLDDSNSWSKTFTDLPKFDKGNAITYSIEETPVPDEYKMTQELLNEGSLIKVTNTHVPYKYNIDGKLIVDKIWEDADDQDGLRATEIKIQLLADGFAYGDEVTLTAADALEDNPNTWRHVYEELPLNVNGEPINYTVEELTTSNNYTIDVNMDTPGHFYITNTHEPIKHTDITVTKNWIDDNDRDRVRPENITLNLIATYKDETPVPELSKSVSVGGQGNTWTYTFDNLPAFNDKGKQVFYEVTENAVTDYQGKVSVDENDENHYIIDNTHIPANHDLTIEKKWVDAHDQDGKRPESIIVNLIAKDAEGNVIDGDSQEVELTIKNQYKDDKDTWVYTFEKVNVNYNGKPIEYSIEETLDEVAQTFYKGNVDKFVITNTHNVSRIPISGEKTWDDEANIYGRPESIEVTLTGKVGSEIVTNITKTVTEKDNWKYDFGTFDEYKDGKQITYTINEKAVLDYTTVIDGYNIKNTYTPATMDIEGAKTWDDNEDQDGIRPESITINLLANGEVVDTTTTNAEKEWKYSFTDKVVYANGVKINYTVEEEKVEGYETSVLDYAITNVHTPATITYTVTKNWEDYNNNDGIRPEKITVRLYRVYEDKDNELLETTDITAENNWTYTFKDLPRYDKGVDIIYSIEEDEVKGYVVHITNNISENDGNITSVIVNSHEKEKTTINIVKDWKDEDNKYKKRPEEITVELYGDGNLIEKLSIKNTDNWKHVVNNLDKYKDGKEIKYTIKEIAVKDYKTTIKDYNITNEIIPPKTGINSGVNVYMVFGLLVSTLVVRFRIKKYI